MIPISMLHPETSQTINTDKYLQGFAIYQSKFAQCKLNGALIGDPTYLLII